jgi:hypothetical protein
MAFVNILFVDVFGLVDSLSYLESKAVLIKYDGAFAVCMTMFLVKDRLACKHSILLAFAVLCHTMILWDLQITSSFVSLFFYSWYDELIILVGILQMAISRNGLNSALRGIRQHILRISFSVWCYSKSFTILKEGKVRT